LKVIEKLLGQAPTTPLYHYTTSEGLRGILSTKSIWASSVFHLNDSLEFRYSLNLIASRAQERARTKDAAEKIEYEQFVSAVERNRNSFQVYVASFSEEPDLLSQWLAYSGANGYSIALSPDQFSTVKEEGFYLVKCEYDPDQQKAMADAFIDAMISDMEGETYEQTKEIVFKSLVIAAAMKHPGFEREAEWRLVKPSILGGATVNGLRFRSGRNGLVPYVAATIADEKASFLPANVHIGPNSDMEAAELALRTYIDFFYSDPDAIAVIPSKTPYRP